MKKLAAIILLFLLSTPVFGPAPVLADELVTVTCLRIYLPDGDVTCFEFGFSLSLDDLIPKEVMGGFQIEQILKEAFPNKDFDSSMQGIKSLEDVTKFQQELMPRIEDVTDTFFSQQLESIDSSNSQSANLDQLKVPSLDQAGLRIPVPKVKYGQEVIKIVNDRLVQKQRRPLDLSQSVPANEALERAFNQILARESQVFTPYVTGQSELNRKMISHAVKTAGQDSAIDTRPLARRPLVAPSDRPLSTAPVPSAQRLGDPQLRSLQARLNDSNLDVPQAVTARRVGLKAVDAAAGAARRGDQFDVAFYKSVAVSMADIALGFVPVVGFGRDVYEAVTGQSVLTDEKLSTTQRALAIAGVVTAGLVPISTTGKILGRIAEEGLQFEKALAKAADIGTEIKALGTAERETVEALEKSLASNPHLDPVAILKDTEASVMKRIEHLGFHVEDMHVESADALNDAYLRARPKGKIPYRPGTLAVTATTSEKSKHLVRVFNESDKNLVGRWVVDQRVLMNEGKLMSRIEIKNLLNLPSIPNQIVDVALDRGTAVRFSEVARTAFGKMEGALQAEIMTVNPGQFLVKTVRAIP